MSEELPALHPIFHGVKIGIGTWQWGDRLYWGYGRDYQDQDIQEAFELCIKSGQVFFDTAEVYAQGRSEMLLGKYVNGSRESIKIATKFMPFPWRLGKNSLNRNLRASLKRLGVPKIALYQMHWPLPPVKIETWMEAMAEAKNNGLIDAAGVSNYDRSQTQIAYDTLVKHGMQLASNQVEYHLLNRKIEKNGLLRQCQELGIAVIAYSPLAQGILSGKYTVDHLPTGFRARQYNRKTMQAIQPLMKLILKIGSDHAGKTPSQVALNWILCKGAIPIPGIKNAQHALQNLEVLGWQLTEAEVAALDDLSDKVTTEI